MTTSFFRLSFFFFLVSIFSWQTTLTQNATFQDIYELLQVRCTSCHGGASPQGGMDLTGSQLEVYNTLVGHNPVNPSALAKGYERVMAGYPERSYILHKLARPGWDDLYGLEIADGNSMPPYPVQPLEKKEIELIRQWILYGAPMDRTVVDPQILEDYYENGLALPATTPLDPPAEGEGFQLRLGPVFLGPLEEREFYKKHEMTNSGAFEVNSMDISFNDESHHFILYKMNPSLGDTYPEGLRNVEDSEESMIVNTLVGAWQNAAGYDLPPGTAYRMAEGTQFDLNYHLKNYSISAVLPAYVYVNVYTQPIGTANQEMHSQIFPVSFFDQLQGAPLGSGLVIPNDGEEHTFTEHLWIPSFPNFPFEGGTWHIWQLSTHTHRHGVDYDVYLATDENGTKGEQIFEGFYNYDYTFNQGYYDWEHPPVRLFEPLFPVNMDFGGGLVHEATYINDEEETLYWGNSVDDEMMLIFMHYTLGEVTASEEMVSTESLDFKLYPNPVSSKVQIAYELEQSGLVGMSLYDLQGRRIWDEHFGKQPAGVHAFELDVAALNLPSAVYMLKITVDGKTAIRELVVE